MRKSSPDLRDFITALLILAGLLSAAPSAAQSTGPAATAINALGIDLLHKAGRPDANVVLSPYSIQSALAMTYGGADGVTRDEMARVLYYPEDELALHRSFAGLRKQLAAVTQQSEERARQMRDFGATNDPIALTVANRLFGQAGFPFLETFRVLVKENYDAPFETLDFVKNFVGATKHINDWVGTQTRQRIRNVIPEDGLNESNRLVLVNAIYLKAPWAEPFEVSATKPGPFHVLGAESVDVPTMTQRHTFLYVDGDGFTGLELPYSGHELRFLILLPKKLDGLASLEARLSSDVLAGRMKWEKRDVTLYLPRFKLEPSTLRLGKALQALGMKTAFDMPVGSANFNRIAHLVDGYLYISDVFHKTFLNLDEKGTEAAAATAVSVRYAGESTPPKPVEVRVDHPFLFAIIHQPSGACLFLGHVIDPR